MMHCCDCDVDEGRESRPIMHCCDCDVDEGRESRPIMHCCDCDVDEGREPAQDAVSVRGSRLCLGEVFVITTFAQQRLGPRACLIYLSLSPHPRHPTRPALRRIIMSQIQLPFSCRLPPVMKFGSLCSVPNSTSCTGEMCNRLHPAYHTTIITPSFWDTHTAPSTAGARIYDYYLKKIF